MKLDKRNMQEMSKDYLASLRFLLQKANHAAVRRVSSQRKDGEKPRSPVTDIRQTA